MHDPLYYSLLLLPDLLQILDLHVRVTIDEVVLVELTIHNFVVYLLPKVDLEVEVLSQLELANGFESLLLGLAELQLLLDGHHELAVFVLSIILEILEAPEFFDVEFVGIGDVLDLLGHLQFWDDLLLECLLKE